MTSVSETLKIVFMMRPGTRRLCGSVSLLYCWTAISSSAVVANATAAATPVVMRMPKAVARRIVWAEESALLMRCMGWIVVWLVVLG